MGVTSPHANTTFELLLRRRFHAMNTDVQVIARGCADAAGLVEAERWTHAFEARFSRFTATSELCALNAHAGAWTHASDDMIALLEACAAMHARTHGAFNPAVLAHLEAAGYDRSFERVERDVGVVPEEHHPVPPFTVEIDAIGRRVRVAEGVRLDFGGIGKGYAADMLIRQLAPLGDVLVDAGGDLRAIGDGSDCDGWLVAVAHPYDEDDDIATLRLRDAALATSTTARRRWQRGGRTPHHIIDPRTGAPADSGAVQVSVIAGTAVEADVFAKAALIMGYEAGAAWLEVQRAPGLFVMEDGTCHRTKLWPSDEGCTQYRED